MKFVNVR